MRTITLLLTILLLPSVSFAEAPVDDGNALLKNCNTALKALDGKISATKGEAAFCAGICFGKVSGVVDAGTIINVFAESRGRNKQNVYCVPDNVSTAQATRVVVKYLKEHSEDLHQRDTALIVTALKEAFPCK